ncbi:MAG: hypothetical protein IJV07_00280 [Alphaproteobacteria bacterium]|nr:hypothetical protein [Alphaproteobacteria bacterium]
MNTLVSVCRSKAIGMHSGVTYGKGLSMLDQVLGTAKLVEDNTAFSGVQKEEVVAAALLHKSFEAKRINGGRAMTTRDIVILAGTTVASIVQELSTEPEDKSKSKAEQWAEKAAWAKTLSPAAQEILQAEKIMNFETTRDRLRDMAVARQMGAENGEDKDGPKSKPAWHKEYIETRSLMVEALHDNNVALYAIARHVRAEALKNVETLEKQNKQMLLKQAALARQATR